MSIALQVAFGSPCPGGDLELALGSHLCFKFEDALLLNMGDGNELILINRWDSVVVPLLVPPRHLGEGAFLEEDWEVCVSHHESLVP